MPKTVLAAFDELLARLALTPDQEKTASTRHTNLRDFLEARFTLLERPWLTGSYSRQTIVRQDRDIDVMACFSHEKYWEIYRKKSSGLVYLLREALNNEYGSSDVSSSGAAVVMKMSVFDVDVVPVFQRDGGGYLVADGSNGWKSTNPRAHAKLMAERNAQDSRLKPTVKLMKYWNLCNDELLESFHLEMMIEQMWRSLTISSYPHGVKGTLGALGSWIDGTTNDPWAPGGRIDTYLSSNVRSNASQNARSDAKSSADAEDLRKAGKEAAAFERWQDVFRKQFPAYG